jgi:hypothetical protein
MMLGVWRSACDQLHYKSGPWKEKVMQDESSSYVPDMQVTTPDYIFETRLQFVGQPTQLHVWSVQSDRGLLMSETLTLNRKLCSRGNRSRNDTFSRPGCNLWRRDLHRMVRANDRGLFDVETLTCKPKNCVQETEAEC